MEISEEPTGWLNTEISGSSPYGRTNEEALKFMESILKENEVYYSIRYPKLEPHWKPAYKIEIQNHNPASKLLNLVSPYLVVKKEQAKILLDFIERRRTAHTSRYTAEDIGAWQRIKELNQVSSETIRQNAEKRKI